MKPPRISEAEWEVMKVLWSGSPCSAQQVILTLSARTSWKPTTVKTLLNRLKRKGAIRFEKTGKCYLYSPAYTRNQFMLVEVDHFLNRVFEGSALLLFSCLIKFKRIKQKDLKSLARAILAKKIPQKTGPTLEK